MDYLKRLSPKDRAWMERFAAEYYDADNKLLRPEKHVEKCRTCRDGGDCGRRPPPQALHSTDELRKECYRRQMWAYYDVCSSGRATLWDDFETVSVDAAGVTRIPASFSRCEARRPLDEAGNYADESSGPFSLMALQLKVRRPRR